MLMYEAHLRSKSYRSFLVKREAEELSALYRVTYLLAFPLATAGVVKVPCPKRKTVILPIGTLACYPLSKEKIP